MPRSKPEIILKQFVHFVDKGRKTEAEPALLILANREGFQWLANYFGELAARKWHTSADCISDPDDHQHLRLKQWPLNPKLSDSMEIRLGVLTSENLRVVKQKYEISARTARRNCLTHRYREFINWAKRHLRSM